MLFKKTAEPFVKSVRAGAYHGGALPHAYDPGCFHPQNGRLRIGAHKPAGAEQDTAEIPGDDDDAVGKPSALEHLQHGHAGCAGGLAVVAVAGVFRLTHLKREHVVRGVRILPADLLNEYVRLFGAFHRRSMSDKAGSVHRIFGVRRGFER